MLEMSTVTSPTRRVLGEKDPNALLSPTKTTKTSLIEGTTLSPRPLKRLASPISPRAGQKRKIVEAYNNEEAEDSQQQQTNNNSQLFLSQHTDVLSSDGPLPEHQDASQSSMAATQHKSTPNTTLTSCHASQEEDSAHLESEFQIHDEPSQQTLDKMHAVSFTQSTSQMMMPVVRPTFNQEPSQASLSMSSLIDFENDLSSQSDEMQMLEDHDTREPQAQPPIKPEEDTRKEMLLEKAETLRTRLQLAIYKIQTNQISKPFWQLTVPKHAPSSPEMPTMSSSSPRAGSSSTLRPSSVHRRPLSAISPESRVAIARARATMESKPPVRPLQSLAVPTIAPTAFSARWAEDTEESHSHPAQEEIPSSPPAASTSEAEDEDPEDEVIIKHEQRDPRSDDSEQEPPKTPEVFSRRRTATGHGQNHPNDEDVALQNSQLRLRGLTSSVIKGEAANSLLQLVRGRGTGTTTSSGVGMCGL